MFMKGFLCALGIEVAILVSVVTSVIIVWWTLRDKDDLQKRDGQL